MLLSIFHTWPGRHAKAAPQNKKATFVNVTYFGWILEKAQH
jgi:hypothetical protein